MKCKKCGTEFDESSIYCPQCGERGPELSDLAPPVDDGSVSDTVIDPSESDQQESMSDKLINWRKEHADEPSGERPAADEPAKKKTPAPTLVWTGSGYSGKAMRFQFICAWLFAVPFVVLGIYLHGKEVMPTGTWLWVVWGLLLLLPALLLCYLSCVYIYRVWTISYRLTEHRFYHEEGFFNRVRDVIEIIDVDDLKLEQSLIDRLINGGVGTVIIESNDATHPKLPLYGLENPEKVFDAIDEARRKQRTERGLKSI